MTNSSVFNYQFVLILTDCYQELSFFNEGFFQLPLALIKITLFIKIMIIKVYK